jgi:hypothetical protein
LTVHSLIYGLALTRPDLSTEITALLGGGAAAPAAGQNNAAAADPLAGLLGGAGGAGADPLAGLLKRQLEDIEKLAGGGAGGANLATLTAGAGPPAAPGANGKTADKDLLVGLLRKRQRRLL